MRPVIEAYIAGWESVAKSLPDADFVASECARAQWTPLQACAAAIEKASKWVHEKNLSKLGYVRIPGATGTKPAKGGGNLVLARKGSELRDKAEKLGLNKKADANDGSSKPDWAIYAELAGHSPEDIRGAQGKIRGNDGVVIVGKSGVQWIEHGLIQRLAGKSTASDMVKSVKLKKGERAFVVSDRSKSEAAKLKKFESNALEHGVWDSGNLSSGERKVLENLVSEGRMTARKGTPDEATSNGIPDIYEPVKADDKAKPREMTPEEKEIADTVAEHKSRDMARSTPRKGESARQELEDATAAAWSEYESHDDAIAEARRFRDSRKSTYSDAYKKADKKYRDLQQKQSDAFDKHKALHNKLSVAILEDHAESGHPIKSELAKLHLAVQNSKNPGMYDGVEKKIHQQVTEHLKKIAPAVAFNTEGHGLLPSDADEVAVNYAVSQVANRIVGGGPSQFDKAESLLSGYIRGERINAYRGIANKKINALENPNGSNRTHEKYNFEDIDKHVSDHVEHDKRVKAQRKAEAAAEKESKAKFINDFDAPNAHAEKPHTIGQIGKLLSNASKRIDFYNTARETGWASDGRFMLKLSDKEIAKIPESPHIDGRRLGQSMIDSVTQYKSGDASVTGSRPTPVGIYDETAKTSQVRFGEGKDAVVADAKLHATIMSRYPNAEIKFGKTPGSVVYVSGGQPVGVLLGIERR